MRDLEVVGLGPSHALARGRTSVDMTEIAVPPREPGIPGHGQTLTLRRGLEALPLADVLPRLGGHGHGLLVVRIGTVGTQGHPHGRMSGQENNGSDHSVVPGLARGPQNNGGGLQLTTKPRNLLSGLPTR